MPESRWRVDVEPVRVGSRAAGVAYRRPSFQRFASDENVREPELVPLRHGTHRDGAIAVVVLLVVAVGVLKPWGETTRDRSVSRSPVQPATAQATAQASAPPRVIGSVVLPAVAFDPAPASCIMDVGWRICVLSASGGQGLRNTFDPHAAPLLPSEAPGSEADPAVLLATTNGAAIGFYPPDGADGDGTGAVQVSAWQVDQELPGTRSVGLKTMGRLFYGDRSAANVFVPPAEALVAADAWPNGGYVFWLKGSGARPWEQYFAVEVVTAVEQDGRPQADLEGGLGPDLGGLEPEPDGLLRVRSLLPGKVAV